MIHHPSISVKELKKQKSANMNDEEAALVIQKGVYILIKLLNNENA